jgi:hypothetical protein
MGKNNKHNAGGYIDPELIKSFDKEKLKAVQLDLKTKGLYKGKLDGIYGRKTLEAIEEYNLRRNGEYLAKKLGEKSYPVKWDNKEYLGPAPEGMLGKRAKEAQYNTPINRALLRLLPDKLINSTLKDSKYSSSDITGDDLLNSLSDFQDIENKLTYFKNTRDEHGTMSPEEKKFRQRIFETVIPGAYNPLESLKEFKSGERRIISDADSEYRELDDLWGMYLDAGVSPLAIKESSHRPSIGKNNGDKYYDSVRINETVKKDLLEKLLGKKNTKVYQNNYSPAFSALGNISLSKGMDDEGKEYVSYYDKFDLDPLRGKVDIDKHFKPIEIYGRIYKEDLAEDKKFKNNGLDKMWNNTTFDLPGETMIDYSKGGYLNKNQMKKKKGYFTGGEIAMIAQYANNMATDYVSAANYKMDPTTDPYKINWSKALTGGVAGMVPELLKASKDKKQRAAYIATATPGNYSKGGVMDEQLSSLAFEVEADPNKVDSKHYPHLNANLDHGEVVMNNKFVFSNRLKNPSTGETFAEEAEKLQKSVGKAEKILKTNPQDAFANNTINLSNRRTQKIADVQETLATLMGHRQDKAKGMALGGYAGPGDPPDYPFLVNLSKVRPNSFERMYYDVKRDSYLYKEAITGNFREYNKGIAEALLGQEDLAAIKELGKRKLESLKTPNASIPYALAQTDAFPSRGSATTFPESAPYKPRTFTAEDKQRTGRVYPNDPVKPLEKTYTEHPIYKLTTTDRTPSMRTQVAPATTDPLNPFGVNDPTQPAPVPGVPRAGGKGTGKKPVSTSKLPQATTSPLDYQSEYDRALYEEMQAAANRNLPQYRGGDEEVLDPEGMFNEVKSTAPARPMPDIASALNFGKTTAGTAELEDKIYNKFTIGDALQGIEVASKFGQLIGGADVETPNFDTTRITKETYDPRNAMYQTNRTLQNALNTMEAPSVNMRRNMANSLYAQRLGQDNNIMSEYNRMNQGANTQYEQRISGQRQYNIGQTNYTEDLNQRNRDTFRNTVQNAFTSLGNFGEQLNAKQQGTDTLKILAKTYPQVYKRMMEEWLKEEQAKTKTTK